MISVIIPVLNEESSLRGTLNALRQQGGQFEVIVVDGGSIDRTREIVATWDRVRLVSSRRGRAIQMNTGADAASGDILLFLHADTTLPPDAILKIDALVPDNNFIWGGFNHRFAGDDWRLNLISHLHKLRFRLSGVFYGDQAMFVRSRTFRAQGGFPEIPILEDVALSEKLLAIAKPLLIKSCVVTSPRKFLKMGVWRSLGRVFVIMTCYRFGLSIPMQSFFEPIR